MKIQKLEAWGFPFLILLHLIPVFGVSYFVTHDGPAHLYNAVLLKEFATGADHSNSIFELTPFPVPNYLGHAIMALFSFVFSPAMSEKLMVAVYIIVLAVSFRKLVLWYSPGNPLLSWLVFPFTHSFLLYMGFYNFCLGTALLLLSIWFFLSRRDKPGFKNSFILFFLTTALYFSHLFCFLFFVFFILLHYLYERVLKEKRSNPFSYLISLKGFSIAVLPGLILAIWFIITQSGGGILPGKRKKIGDLIEWIGEGRPFITLKDTEYIYTWLFGLGIAVLLIQTLAYRWQKERKWLSVDLFLFSALLSLIACFVFPDEAATGGFVSVRWILFFFIFLALWISSQPQKFIYQAVLVLVFTGLSCYRIYYHYKEEVKLSGAVEDYVSVGAGVHQHDVLLPLNYSENWMHSNISNYLGAETGAQVLDNYEGNKPHFPLRFRKGKNPYTNLGNFAGKIPPQPDFYKYFKGGNRLMDEVVRWRYKGQNDSCSLFVDSLLKRYYKRVAVSPKGDLELFHVKEQ
jgi:hypothetical protein